MKRTLAFIIVIIFVVNSAGHGFALRPIATNSSEVLPEIKKFSPTPGKRDQFKVSVREYPGNPILIPDYEIEAFVLNPGAIKIGNMHYLAVRSSTNDNLSRVFIAVSKDGYNFKRKPGFFYTIPGIDSKGGIEDPRLTIVKEFPDRVFMHFTYCHDGIYEIAESSINIQDFVCSNPAGWSPIKKLFPGKKDKNFTLIPRMLNNGRYYAYHRPDFDNGQSGGRGIYLSYTDDLIGGTWKNLGVIMVPEKDCWIGAGTVLEAENVWVLIYHEGRYITDTDRRYVCKIALVDKENPANILYTAEEPILESGIHETEMLKKIMGLESWVPNVKFANGATILGKEKVLTKGSEILIYYGLNDTVISIATLKIEEMPNISIISSVRSKMAPVFNVIKAISSAA